MEKFDTKILYSMLNSDSNFILKMEFKKCATLFFEQVALTWLPPSTWVMYVCAKPSSMPVENCPPFLGGDPWKMGAHFQAWPQPFFETLLLAQKQSFCFSQRKKNQCKRWKCAGSTYFKSKFWYNREFSLCYVDKLVQIWFLSLPWQLLDISIFLRDFFLLLNNTCLIQICLDLMCAHKETFITCKQKSLMIENDFYQG